jgi:hypothetical protein
MLFGQYGQNLALIERRLNVVAEQRGNHVTIEGSRDEFDELSSTVNRMLERIEQQTDVLRTTFDSAAHRRVQGCGFAVAQPHPSPHLSQDSAAAPEIDLQKIILDRVSIRYEDLYAAQLYSLNVHDATLKGRFANEDFELSVNSKMLVENLYIDKVNYLQNKEVDVDTRLTVNYRQGLYRFDESKLTVADLIFRVKGELVDDHGHQGAELEDGREGGGAAATAGGRGGRGGF